MQAAERTRRDWSIALAASILIHVLTLGFVRFAPVPSPDVADDATPVAILRIDKRVAFAHGRRGGAPAAPPIARTAPQRSAPTEHVARGATARGTIRAKTTADASPPGARSTPSRSRAAAAARPGANAAAPANSAEPASGAATNAPAASAAAPIESPAPAPTLSTEMLARLNQRMHDAIPSSAPQTMKHSVGDLSTVAMRADPNRWTAANYPLPQKGLFAHAIIVRVGREAVAVRAIQRIGKAYICVGYLAKVNEHDPQATLAGPYVGPCKKAWREQLGLVPKPSPSPSADSSAPVAPSPAPSGSSDS